MSATLSEMLVAVAAALVGGIIAIISNACLARRNKRDEERIKFLSQAYLDLEFGLPRSLDNPISAPYSDTELDEMYQRFNRSMATIGLMGTKRQVEIMRQIYEGGGTDFTSLVLDLRDSLRVELGLERLEPKHFWLVQRRNRKAENQ